jgi:hypothetical protein
MGNPGAGGERGGPDRSAATTRPTLLIDRPICSHSTPIMPVLANTGQHSFCTKIEQSQASSISMKSNWKKK